MKNGDISNIGGYTIAFRVEDCILTPKKDSNKFMGFCNDKIRLLDPLHNYEPNEPVLTLINSLFRNTYYNIVAVVDEKYSQNNLVMDVLSILPVDVMYVHKYSQIITALKVKSLDYYVDNEPYRLACINTDGALTFKEFRELCGRWAN